MATQILLESVTAVIESLNPYRSRGSLASQAEDCAPIVEALGYVDLGAFLRSYYATPHGETSAVREQAAAASTVWGREQRKEFERVATSLGMTKPDGSFDHDWVDAEAEEARRAFYEADAIVDPVNEDDIEPVCYDEGELAG